MESMLFTSVFVLAVLLLDIHCLPLQKGLAPMYDGGYTGGGPSRAPEFYQPEGKLAPGYDRLSGPGDQYRAYVKTPALPSGHGQRFTPESPQDISWVLPPSVFSGDAGPSIGHGSPSGPQFIPGELLRIKSTMEDGGFQSETQEKGAGQGAVVYGRPPQPNAAAPMGRFRPSFPYDWMFLTGQYAPGTYPDVTRSAEHGRDDWQVNHYRRYDQPARRAVQQKFQTYPSAYEQSFLMPGAAAQEESQAAYLPWPRHTVRDPMSYHW